MVDRKTQDAVLFRLLRISEAVSKLGDDAVRLAPEQPWAQVRAFGNVLRHQYDDIDMARIWEIIQTDLEGLRHACERVLGRTGPV